MSIEPISNNGIQVFNTVEQRKTLYGELEGKKISGCKKLAWKALGVALIVLAVATAIFSLALGIVEIGGYGAMIIALPGAFITAGIGGLGVECWNIGNNEKLSKAQRALSHDMFLKYAQDKGITLTSKNLYTTIADYKNNEWKRTLDNAAQQEKYEAAQRELALASDI